MNKTLTISVIALIAVVMVIGVVSPAMAKEGNNGGNGCENANPNAKSCEKNPNTDIPTCEECLAELAISHEACDGDVACQTIASEVYFACLDKVPVDERTCVEPPPPD